uniref:Mutant protein of dihydroflavonol reductase n=3 Tax=Brassicaceae TaxID=3700 RepID=Q5DWV7_ARATH|nr:mutant protein of dihydroflavonol reductase [Arabidopsis thaliana]
MVSQKETVCVTGASG